MQPQERVTFGDSRQARVKLLVVASLPHRDVAVIGAFLPFPLNRNAVPKHFAYVEFLCGFLATIATVILRPQFICLASDFIERPTQVLSGLLD
jgi:hypothetical protein